MIPRKVHASLNGECVWWKWWIITKEKFFVIITTSVMYCPHVFNNIPCHSRSILCFDRWIQLIIACKRGLEVFPSTRAKQLTSLTVHEYICLIYEMYRDAYCWHPVHWRPVHEHLQSILSLLHYVNNKSPFKYISTHQQAQIVLNCIVV